MQFIISNRINLIMICEISSSVSDYVRNITNSKIPGMNFDVNFDGIFTFLKSLSKLVTKWSWTFVLSYPSPKSQLCNKIHVLWYVCQNSKNWIWRFIFHSHILYSFVSTFQCHFCLTKWLCLNLKALTFFFYL